MALARRTLSVLALPIAIFGLSLADAARAAEEGADAAAGEEEADPRGLVMQGMDAAGIGGSLDDGGIALGGLIEASYTRLIGSRSSDEIVGRLFDFEDDEFTLNELFFWAKREADFEKPWDLGFYVELLYGADARLTPSNGLFDDDHVSNEEFDITAGFVELVLPIGTGLKAQIGKFITPIGYEYVEPRFTSLYSHSFLDNLTPYSQTGVLLTYNLSDQWLVTGVISRGWDQSLEDNNDSIDGLVGFTYTPSEETSMTLNLSIGPQLDDDDDSYRYMFDFYLTHRSTERLLLALAADYIIEENTDQDGGASETYGVAGYATYELSDRFALNGRADWVRDKSVVDGFDANLYEITVGVTITPFPENGVASSLSFRPELRYDFSDEAVFDDGLHDDQLTFGIDALFVF